MSAVIFIVNHAMYIELLLMSLRLLCMQDGITHSNGALKGSVYFDWTAPDNGSGALTFGYNNIDRQAGIFRR